GLRHRTMLPDRYRRYFLGSVIPYAVFALYIGLTAPNTDNWGHLGGLIAGASVATFLPPRLLEPKDSAFIPKIVLALLVLILIFGMSFFPPSLPEPQANRYYAFNGFSLPIPRKWSTVFSQRRGQNENRVYANSAGVNLSVHTEYTSKEVDLVQHLRAFVESDLAIQLEQSSAQGLQMSDPIPTHVAGLRGLQFDIRVLAGEEIAQASYIILARSHYVYIVGYVAPDWLYQRYITVFTKAIQSASLEETDWLSRARDHYNKEHSIKNTKDLVRALYAVGQKNEAQSIIKKGKEEHDIDPQIFISNPESSQ
ncbi:hypothetical protein KAI87_13065, partial [Myxococcota bacterium]|nr:hypothetical protein [Myxococcota bacterium]